MLPVSARQLNSAIVIAVIGLMSYGLYTEYVDGLIPCPLCMTQRYLYCLVGLFALLAVLHNPGITGRRIYAALLSLSAIGGAAAAGRQVWLQHLPPDKVPACGPSLEYMLDTFPFAEVLKVMIRGDGNCAEIDWTFLTLSMAEWSLIWFIGFAVAGLWLLIRR